MAWQDEMVPLFRAMVFDFDSETYSDDRAEEILAAAAKLVSTSLSFSQDFVASAANITITPDPTATATKDDDFVNLVCMKAACMVDHGEVRSMVKQGLLVKDGSSTVDLRTLPAAKLKLLEQGWCATYAREAFEYQHRLTSGSVGAVVLGPFRLYALGSFDDIMGHG